MNLPRTYSDPIGLSKWHLQAKTKPKVSFRETDISETEPFGIVFGCQYSIDDPYFILKTSNILNILMTYHENV